MKPQYVRTRTLKQNSNISFPVGTAIAVQNYTQKLNFEAIFSKFKQRGISLPNIVDVLYELTGAPGYPYTGNLVIAKDAFGGVYWPQWSLNTIGDVTIGWGYQVKCITQDTINVVGLAVVPELTPLNLPLGWSIIGYLRQSPADITVMFADIATLGQVSNLVIAKDAFGGIYWPQYWLNTIGNFKPGEGYYLKTASESSLTLYAPSPM